MKLRTAMILAHACVVLSVVFMAYSLKNYLAVSNIVLPSVTASAAPGASAIDPRSLQGVMLFAIESYESFALYQLVGWTVAWVLSVAAVVVLHRAKSRAG